MAMLWISKQKREFTAMSETFKTILLILVAVGAVILALRIAGWKMKKACDFIVRDLKEKKALDPASAVELPYTKSQMINIGLKDYRPKALEELVKHDVVRMLDGGRCYLREGHKLSAPDDRTAA
jgi:hypothetical protein